MTRFGTAGIYFLFAALLAGTLWRGGYFAAPKWTFAALLLLAGATELGASAALKELRLPRSPGFWLFAAFCLFAGASLAWSASRADTIREAVLLAGLIAAMFTAQSQLRRSGAKALMAIAFWLAYSSAFVCAWGIGTYIFRTAPYSGNVDGLLRAGSTFEYSNALSCFGLMSLPVTVTLHGLAARSDRPLLAIVIGLQVAAVLLSYARFGYAALFLLFIYFVITAWRKGTAGAIILSLAAGLTTAAGAAAAETAGRPQLGLMAVALVSGAAWAGHRWLEQASGKRSRRLQRLATGAFVLGGAVAAAALAQKSARLHAALVARFEGGFAPSRLLPHRLETFRGALDAFLVRPVAGSGLGTFAGVYQRYAIAAYSKFAHNLVLQAAVDTGLIGAISMALFLGYVVVLSARRLLADTGQLPRAFAVASLVFVAYNMFDWEWYIPALSGWFVVGLMCVEAPVRDAEL